MVKSPSKVRVVDQNDIPPENESQEKPPPYNFELNLQHNCKVEYNLEEIKKDRNKLIKKISNTLKVKNKAPSTT